MSEIQMWASPGDLTRVDFRITGNLMLRIPNQRAFDTRSKARLKQARTVYSTLTRAVIAQVTQQTCKFSSTLMKINMNTFKVNEST